MLQKAFYSYLYSILILIVSLLSFVVYFSSYSFSNYRFFSVQSGSMEPTLKVGDLILTKKEEYYSINSIITLKRDSDRPLTHRLIEIKFQEDVDDSIYYTKGDKNTILDKEEFRKEDIIGRMIFRIPLLGTLVDFLKTDLGLGLFIITPAAYIIFNELQSIKRELNYKKKKQ